MTRDTYHHGDLKRALVDAAKVLLEESGVPGLSLRAAARRAGVSPAAPYRHYPDKASLLAALAAVGFEDLRRRLKSAADDENVVAALRNSALVYVHFALENPAQFRVMFGPEASERIRYPELADAAANALSVLVDIIARCQNAGIIRSGNPMELATGSHAAIHGLAALVVAGHFGPVDELRADQLAELVSNQLFVGLATRHDP